MDKPLRMLFAATSHEDLLRIIRSVKWRWRAGMALRGLSIVAMIGVVAFVLSAYGMDRFRFNPTAVAVFRILVYSSLVAAAARFLIWPFRRRISDEQVALYLEEHEPSLKGHVVSGVQFGSEADGAPSQGHSPELIRKLVRSAIEKCVTIEEGRRVDRRRIVRSSGILAGATMMGMALLVLSPGFVRYSAPFLLAPWSNTESSNPYSIEVSPGHITLARGADLRVAARLLNFDSDEIDLAVKRGNDGAWERLPMTVDEESGEYVLLLFDIDAETEYFVEASGVRSALYHIEVADLPYVDRIDLEYQYPAYTGLSPQRQENGGDIAAVAGTRVVLYVTPTLEITEGVILVDDRDTLALQVSAQGVLSGGLVVREVGFYRVLLRSFQGELVTASPDFLIDVLEDQPPSISFAKPGRDIDVSAVEEVFAEVRAEDDYGIARLELVYSVNGSAAQSVQLFGGSVRKDVSASHTFFLEEWELEPGDFVSYYARAIESERKVDPQVIATDIYFMEVRPFNREYRQAEQQGGGEMGAGGGMESGLSERQRDIVAGTFKMVRDRERYGAGEYRENLATLALAQGKLKEEVQTLVQRITTRGIVQLDSGYLVVAEELPLAVEQMETAERLLGERQPEEAMSPEQRALQHLQRAEAAYREVQVSRGQRSGGGGGGQQSDAEDLADLFDLELDKMRNQYEQVQRGAREQVDNELDEVEQKLKELAQRQQQENERLRARQQRQANQNAGGGGQSQRRLAEEAEELARQLERLSRENSRPELERTARSIREAVEEMQRAAANSRNNGVAQGVSALDRLRDARRLLDQDRTARTERDAEDILRRVQRLTDEQRDVMSDVDRLSGDPSQLERINRLRERKEAMAAEVDDIEGQLDQLSRDSQRDQREASRKLREAAESIRDDKLKEKILYSRGVIATGSRDYIRNFEEQINSDIEKLREIVQEGVDAVGESRDQRLSRSLDKTRDAVTALESLGDRIRNQAEQQGQQRQQGQEVQGQPEGQQGQQGQEQPQEQQGQQAQGGAAGLPQAGGQPPAQGGGGQGRLNPEAMRQFGRELTEREGDLTQLREELRREGVDVEDLDAVIGQLRDLGRRREFGDPRGLAELETEIIQGLKDFEFSLRKQLLGETEGRMFLAGSDDVPSGYRELVEEYFRELSRSGRNRR
jgi:hypothetical protein